MKVLISPLFIISRSIGGSIAPPAPLAYKRCWKSTLAGHRHFHLVRGNANGWRDYATIHPRPHKCDQKDSADTQSVSKVIPKSYQSQTILKF